MVVQIGTLKRAKLCLITITRIVRKWLSGNLSTVNKSVIIIIIMKEFIVRLLQCGHEHRCITLQRDISQHRPHAG